MKSVLGGFLVCALGLVANAATIAVTGGGILDTPSFGVSGDNFDASFHLPGLSSVFPCHRGTTCNFSIFSGFSIPGGGGNEFFQGQTGATIDGGVTVTGSLTIPATGPSGGFTVPVSVTASFTGYRHLNRTDPFFSAFVTGEGTLTTDFGANALGDTDPTFIEFFSPTYMVSGTANVSAISGSEVPEPSSPLLIAGGLALMIISRLRLVRSQRSGSSRLWEPNRG
jgi:hypothetical protein